ncbi:MAG: DNA alkylation repair protein [Candidatus Odinarchaeota archaeon]
MIQKVVKEIRKLLLLNKSNLTEEQMNRMYKIINPDNANYEIYGIRVAIIDKIVKTVSDNFECDYNDAVEIFKELIRSNVEEEKFSGFLFLNRFNKFFNQNTIKLFHDELLENCHTWSVLDSSCIRVLGPFLAKKGNEALVKQTINEWANSKNFWIKRGSMVLLLKIIMVRKEFDKEYVYNLVEKMLEFSNENYIEKGIGWLLKTCSKYNPDLIYEYLMENRNRFTRLILRYASEKLVKEKRAVILKK